MPRFRRRFGGRVKRVRYKHIKVAGEVALNSGMQEGGHELDLPITLTGISGAEVEINDWEVQAMRNLDPAQFPINGMIQWRLLYIAAEPERIVGLTIWTDFQPDDPPGLGRTIPMTSVPSDAYPGSIAHAQVGYIVVRVPAGEPIGQPINPATTGNLMYSQLYPNAKNTMLFGSGIVSGNRYGAITRMSLANKMHTKRKLFEDDRVYVGMFTCNTIHPVAASINVVAFVES